MSQTFNRRATACTSSLWWRKEQDDDFSNYQEVRGSVEIRLGLTGDEGEFGVSIPCLDVHKPAPILLPFFPNLQSEGLCTGANREKRTLEVVAADSSTPPLCVNGEVDIIPAYKGPRKRLAILATVQTGKGFLHVPRRPVHVQKDL